MRFGLEAAFRVRFGRGPEIVTRAPGRVEFIGNHTDYNGGAVLGAAIDRTVWVGLARRGDGVRRFSTQAEERVVERSAADPERAEGADRWLNYPLGVLAAMAHFGLPVPGGFDLHVESDLPPGAGLSSSAALELASALAFAGAAGAKMPTDLLVRIGRHAENHFVGVPCGILDQGVSGFGRRGELVFIDCRRPAFSTVPMPGGAHFWIFSTHVGHALVDGLYAERHRECAEAARMLGVGLLADLTPGAFETAAYRLPEVLCRRARHVVEEIARVGGTVAALKAGDLKAVGALLTASHRSSQRLFENSTPELDFLVDALASSEGVFGARLTGGGFGGSVLALASPRFGPERAGEVAEKYVRRFGASPAILRAGTADGAERIA
ncbi:MAG: galactokinase [Opitutaceae bacterium]